MDVKLSILFDEYEIYGRNNCTYCDAAKALLERKGLKYRFLNIEEDPSLLQEFKELFPNAQSVPQILGWEFNGVVHSEMGGEYEDMVETHIGGYKELDEWLKKQ
jgi:glutaredoxin